MNLSRKKFVFTLIFFVVVLFAANLFVVYSEMIKGEHYSFAWRFYFDRRLNFPFFFSLFLQLTNLYLLFRILSREQLTKSQRRFWRTLFITFFLFALDETFYIHQHFKMSTFGVIASYDRASWSHYLWVIPYFVVFGSLFIMLFVYSRDIARDLRVKMLVAGTIFLSGAVAMEFVGTFYAVFKPEGDVYLLLIKSAEGVLQMVGSVMFIDSFWRTPDAGK